MEKRSITVGYGTKMSLILNLRALITHGYLALKYGNKMESYDLYKAMNLYLLIMTTDEFCEALEDGYGEKFDFLDRTFCDYTVYTE